MEQSIISLTEFDDLFFKESSDLGYPVKGSEVLSLLEGNLRPKMIEVIKKLKNLGFIQACLTNNFIPTNELQPDIVDQEEKNNILDRRWLEEFGGLIGMRVSDLLNFPGLSKKNLISY